MGGPEKNRSPDTMPSLLCNARPLSDTRWNIRFPAGFRLQSSGNIMDKDVQLGRRKSRWAWPARYDAAVFNDRPLFPWYSIGHPRRREPLTHARKILGRHGVGNARRD